MGHAREVSDVLAAADVDSFLREPVGRFVIGRTYAFYQLKSSMTGLLVWGSPELRDVDEMTRVIEVATHHPSLGRHVSLVDAREISAIDGAAFERLISYLHAQRDACARLIVRQALVVRRGVIGAALAGLYAFVGAGHPTKSFQGPDLALAWLDPPDHELALRAFRWVHDRVRGTPETVARVRSILEAEGRALPLVELARRVDVSPRTLQRRLTEASTSLRDEVQSFRLRTATRLLEDSTLPLSEVARSVGMSPAQFTKFFCAARGTTPRAFRREARAERAGKRAGDA